MDLEVRGFCCGLKSVHGLSIIDLVSAIPSWQVLEPSFRQAFPNTNRWFLTCINQPQFRAISGEVKLCEKMAWFDAKKFAESQPKKDTPRKEKGSREEKQTPG